MSWMSPLTVPMTTLPIGLRAGLGEERPQDRHAGLHRVRREQDLGHEQDAVAEVDPDDAHALDQRVVEDLVRAPATAEQDVRPLHDLGRHAVVQVVVHLLDQLVVGERREIERLAALVVVARVGGHAQPFPHRGTMPYSGTLSRHDTQPRVPCPARRSVSRACGVPLPCCARSAVGHSA